MATPDLPVVMSISVRPLQVSHLCFEVDGVLGQLNLQLGATVTPFDFNSFYTTLIGAPTVSGDASRLAFDPAAIQSFVGPSALASLRAEASKAALLNAICSRQNAYFAKFGNASAIISAMNTFFSPSVATSKPNRLINLSNLATNQATALQGAYTTDGRTGVVKTTNSALNSQTSSSGTTTERSQSSQESMSYPHNTPAEMKPLPPGGAPFTETVTGSVPVNVGVSQSSEGQTVSSSSSATQAQSIVNTDYGYRTPFMESQAQNERAQISLIDQQFAQLMFGQNLPNLATVFQNELNMIDNNVYRLQVAFLNTILMSPIPGTVTGIYKNPGDCVKAGEPVLRVENTGTILLVAKLVYRGSIQLGATIQFQTLLYDSPSSQTLTGNVVAVRGQREDQQWEVIAQCNNLDGGKPIFPLGYNFDYDDTKVLSIA